ncbi:1997_t:CDS:1, partial [Ambispora gerdemannii]
MFSNSNISIDQNQTIPIDYPFIDLTSETIKYANRSFFAGSESELKEKEANDNVFQEIDPNDYVTVYTHLQLDTYKNWIKNILPNIS